MTKHGHMPPIPPGNRSSKGTGDKSEVQKNTSQKKRENENFAERGETANIDRTRRMPGSLRAGA